MIDDVSEGGSGARLRGEPGAAGERDGTGGGTLEVCWGDCVGAQRALPVLRVEDSAAEPSRLKWVGRAGMGGAIDDWAGDSPCAMEPGLC